jgi:hypothetical protein
MYSEISIVLDDIQQTGIFFDSAQPLAASAESERKKTLNKSECRRKETLQD